MNNRGHVTPPRVQGADKLAAAQQGFRLYPGPSELTPAQRRREPRRRGQPGTAGLLTAADHSSYRLR